MNPAELLALARTLNTRGDRWFPAPAMARASSLEGRVAAMLNADINRRPIAKSTRLTTAAALLALALGVAAFSASAQTFASLSGSVADQLGGAVSGVTLTLAHRETGQKYEVRSNAVGAFEFVGLIAGEYDLESKMPGFRSATGRVMVSGKNLRQDVQLRVGSLEETITVVASAEPRPADAPQTPQVRTGTAPAPKACETSPAGGRIAQPRKIADARPIYPANLGAAKIDGVIVLDALIGPDGTVREVSGVDPTAHPDLVHAAIEAVRLWRYTPTLLNCVPIDVAMKVTVNFKVE